MIGDDKEWPSIGEIFLDTVCSEEKSSIENDVVFTNGFVSYEGIFLNKKC